MIFKPKVLEAVNSKVSGKFEVRKLDFDTYVTTNDLTQSGGLINELWSKTLKKVSKSHSLKNKGWLILGLATGTLAKLVSKKYSPIQITGVELDPEMIRVGKKYFGLDKISHLKVVQADANKYVFEKNKIFDVIIVDLYIGDQLPKFVYQKKFLSKLKSLGNLVILNHLFYDEVKKKNAQKLLATARGIYTDISLVRELTNLLIVCSHD